MAVSKVILNGETLMDVTVDTVTSEKLLTGYQATGRDGVKVQGAYVPQSADLTTGSVNPSESSQHVTPPTGYDGFEYVDVAAVSSDYVGSNVARNSAADVTISGPAISIPSGYYGSGVETAIAEGSVVVTRNYASPSIGNVSLDSTTGIVSVARESADYTITAYGYAGYITSVTANGTFTIRSAETSYALSTQAAAVITPIESSQIAVASGKYTLGNIEVAAISSDYVGSAVTQNSAADVTISGPTVNIPSGYYNSDVSKAVSTVAMAIPTIEFNTTTGAIQAKSTQAAGYVAAGSTTVTSSLGIITGTTITPTESIQTIGGNAYVDGTLKVAAIPSDYIGSAIDSVSIIQGTTTINGSTVERGVATWSAGVISSGSISAATFANSSTAQTEYVDISETTEAPILISGDYLYINKGYTDNLKISLAKLAPDSASADLSSDKILSGYAAYNNDGELVAGNIPSKTSVDVTVAGPTVSIPSGYYATDTTAMVTIGNAGSPIATKDAVDNHSILVRPSVTNTTGYITGGTKVGTGVTVSASELVSGTKNIAANGSGIDVTEYKYVDVNIDSKLYIATISWSSTKHSRTNIKYNNVTYQTEGDTFTFHAGDTAILEAYGEVGGGGIYINNVEVAYTDHNQPYIYTLPANNIDFILSTNGGGSISGTTNDTIEITTNGTHNIEYYTYADVDVQPALQSKIGIVPTESSQIIAADSNYDGLSSVQIAAISSDYVGSNITQRNDSDLSAVGSVVTAPAGYYSAAASTTIAAGSFSALPVVTSLQVGAVSLDSNTGVVTVARSSQNFSNVIVANTTQAGYISANTSSKNDLTIEANSTTYALSTVTGATIIPTESSQIAVASGKYTLGDVSVAAISSDYIGSAIPTHDSADLSISVNVVTVPSGYYPSDAVAPISKGSVTVSGGGTVTPTINVSSGGIITAANNSVLFMSPNVVQAGYISQSDKYSGQVSISGSNTYQLSVAMGTTIIPTTTTQTAVAVNKYTTGAIQVQGDADLIPANIVEGVSIFGVAGTALVGVAMTTAEILENAAEGWGISAIWSGGNY